MLANMKSAHVQPSYQGRVRDLAEGHPDGKTAPLGACRPGSGCLADRDPGIDAASTTTLGNVSVLFPLLERWSHISGSRSLENRVGYAWLLCFLAILLYHNLT